MTLPYPPPFQDLATLAEHTCMGASTIQRMVDEGKFPAPRKNKCGKRLWVWKEVEAWLAAPDDDRVSETDRITQNGRRLFGG